MTLIHDKAKKKLVELEKRKSELNMPEQEYNSKITWLKRVLFEEDLEHALDDPAPPDGGKNKHLLSIDLAKTRQIANNTYNLEEIKTLCFDFDIDFENLGGEGKEAKIREFVWAVARSGQILRLIVEITRKNNNISWDNFH